VGAAADVIHGCAGCGAVGIAKNDQVLHVIVVVYRELGQIYTQIVVRISLSALYTS